MFSMQTLMMIAIIACPTLLEGKTDAFLRMRDLAAHSEQDHLFDLDGLDDDNIAENELTEDEKEQGQAVDEYARREDEGSIVNEAEVEWELTGGEHDDEDDMEYNEELLEEEGEQAARVKAALSHAEISLFNEHHAKRSDVSEAAKQLKRIMDEPTDLEMQRQKEDAEAEALQSALDRSRKTLEDSLSDATDVHEDVLVQRDQPDTALTRGEEAAEAARQLRQIMEEPTEAEDEQREQDSNFQAAQDAIRRSRAQQDALRRSRDDAEIDALVQLPLPDTSNVLDGAREFQRLLEPSEMELQREERNAHVEAAKATLENSAQTLANSLSDTDMDAERNGALVQMHGPHSDNEDRKQRTSEMARELRTIIESPTREQVKEDEEIQHFKAVKAALQRSHMSLKHVLDDVDRERDALMQVHEPKQSLGAEALDAAKEMKKIMQEPRYESQDGTESKVSYEEHDDQQARFMAAKAALQRAQHAAERAVVEVEADQDTDGAAA